MSPAGSRLNSPAAGTTVDELFQLLEVQGHTDYLGERVSQLEHSLQCAYLAAQAHADEETIIGSLLHDVGRFISQEERLAVMRGDDGTLLGPLSHEVVGEKYLRSIGFSEKVCQLVGAHVIAKRYLTATDPGYYDALSATSKKTLRVQASFGRDLTHAMGADPCRAGPSLQKKWNKRDEIRGCRRKWLFAGGMT